jgi:FAD/FMN-containing dehydrogenase
MLTVTGRTTAGLLDHLRSRVRGQVLARGDEGYDQARAAWNLNARHHPAAVLRAMDASDVRTAVRVAGAAGLGVGVLATGHGTGRPCIGGLLINTSAMRGVELNPAAGVARVAAGTVWDEVIGTAAPYGLATLPGSSTKVGVVGCTLGGGFGWLGRRYGLAAHSVTRAEVVTADGELVTASPNEHPELFWGLLGSGGNLGVVTALEFRLHRVQQVYGGNLYYPLERSRDVLTFFAELSESAPPELTSAVAFRRFPPLPSVPEPLRGRSLIAFRGCFCGNPAVGAALVDRARTALGRPTADTFTEMSAAALAVISMDPVDPLGALNHSELLSRLTPDAIDALVDLGGPDSGSPLVILEVRQLGGALSGPAGALSPLAHSNAGFSLNAIGITPTPEQAAAVRAHLHKVATTMRRHATGETYLNFLDLDGVTPERVRAAYSAQDWNELLRLKYAYDPSNLFRFNRNIQPTHAQPRNGAEQ